MQSPTSAYKVHQPREAELLLFDDNTWGFEITTKDGLIEERGFPSEAAAFHAAAWAAWTYAHAKDVDSTHKES